MVSIISIILDLVSKIRYLNIITKIFNYSRLDNIIVVHRLPPRKVLRAHQLGLTFGLLLAILTICLNPPAIFSDLPWYTPFLSG